MKNRKGPIIIMTGLAMLGLPGVGCTSCDEPINPPEIDMNIDNLIMNYNELLKTINTKSNVFPEETNISECNNRLISIVSNNNKTIITGVYDTPEDEEYPNVIYTLEISKQYDNLVDINTDIKYGLEQLSFHSGSIDAYYYDINLSEDFKTLFSLAFGEKVLEDFKMIKKPEDIFAYRFAEKELSIVLQPQKEDGTRVSNIYTISFKKNIIDENGGLNIETALDSIADCSKKEVNPYNNNYGILGTAATITNKKIYENNRNK